MPKKPKLSAAETEDYLNFFASLERDLSNVSGAGRPPDQRAALADELLNAAEDAPNPIESIPFLLRAVRLNPACIDARLTLMHIAGGPDEEIIEELRELLPLAEHDLGPGYLKANRGHFWGLIETRPYMRVRAELAQTLYRAGQTGEAIAEFEEILSLNANDNLGMRYTLLGVYLEARNLTQAARLLKKYPEPTAVWLWAQVLERILAEDLDAAALRLAVARTQNPHVEDFLTGRKKIPSAPPPYYEPGKVSEAVMCIGAIGPAWASSKPAVLWLSAQPGRTPRKAAKKKQTVT